MENVKKLATVFGLDRRQKMQLYSAIRQDSPKVEYTVFNYDDGTKKVHSTLEFIKHFLFDTVEEVEIVNAIYKAQKKQDPNFEDNFDRDKFQMEFRMTFRILRIKSGWAD